MPGHKLRFDNPEGEQLLKDIEDFETKRLDAICNALRIPAEYFDKNYVSIEVPVSIEVEGGNEKDSDGK